MIFLVNDGTYYVLDNHPEVKVYTYTGSSNGRKTEAYHFQLDDGTQSDTHMAYGVALAGFKPLEQLIVRLNRKILFHRLKRFEKENGIHE